MQHARMYVRETDWVRECIHIISNIVHGPHAKIPEEKIKNKCPELVPEHDDLIRPGMSTGAPSWRAATRLTRMQILFVYRHQQEASVCVYLAVKCMAKPMLVRPV